MLIYEDSLVVGLLQTNIPMLEAWRGGKVRTDNTLNMEYQYEELLWNQLAEGFSYFKRINQPPNIIIAPEMTIPHPYRQKFAHLCTRIGAIGIAGLDFCDNGYEVENKGLIVVPQHWRVTGSTPHKKSSRYKTYLFGKRLFSVPEQKMIEMNGRKGVPHQTTFLIDAKEYGRIGIGICADVFDIQCWEIYRGRIHHFVLIAYNKDVETFINFAHTISRTVYCNVIICNAGEFGSTIIVSPYKKGYQRVVFHEIGQNIKNYQTVSIPIAKLDQAQIGNDTLKEFKTMPPGYEQRNLITINPQFEQINL